MEADGESLDVGVRIGAGSSLSIEEHREQGSPMSSAENTRLTPGSSELQTPGMPLCGSPAMSDVGVRAMEYRIRHNLKKDSFSVVEGMRIHPVQKSSMKIPLCRLIHMPLVRPTLRSDVTKLMAAFQFGYRAGSATLYVSTTNESGENRFVSAKDRREWGEASVDVCSSSMMVTTACLRGKSVSNQITKTMLSGTTSMVAQNVSSWTQRVGVGMSLTQCTTLTSKYDIFSNLFFLHVLIGI
jgi:hypothetical protein